MKKKILSLLLIGILIISVAGCGKNKEIKSSQESPPKDIEPIVLVDNLSFEVNEELKLLSLVSEDNKTTIVSENEIIDTSILGEKEITIKYLDQEKEYTFKINIIDTQAPTIVYKKEVSTTEGTKIDLLKDVKVSDNSKEEITATIEGEYDIDKVGTYNLKYVAIDSSNNKTEEEFILKVNAKTSNSTKNTTSNNSKTQNNTTTNNDVVPNNNTKTSSSQGYKTETETISEYRDYKYGLKVKYNITITYRVYDDGKKEEVNKKEVNTGILDISGYNAEPKDLYSDAMGYYYRYGYLVESIKTYLNETRINNNLNALEIKSETGIISYIMVLDYYYSGRKAHFTEADIMKSLPYDSVQKCIIVGGYDEPEPVAEYLNNHYSNWVNNSNITSIGIGYMENTWAVCFN